MAVAVTFIHAKMSSSKCHTTGTSKAARGLYAQSDCLGGRTMGRGEQTSEGLTADSFCSAKRIFATLLENSLGFDRAFWSWCL